MWYSLLVRLAMLALTMGVVFWIGWTLPQSPSIDSDHSIDAQASGGIGSTHSVTSQGKPAETSTPVAPSTEKIQTPRQPAAKQLDLNTATEQDLETLPGIGPVLAERIVEFRRSRGGFHDVAQLRNVKGIGKKKFERIRTIVRVTRLSMHQRGDRNTT